MRPPGCVGCGLPVLELVGQSATLPPYLIVNGAPPPQTAGSWHLSCLHATAVGPQWARALERNYLDVRQHDLVARTSDWAVLRNPRSGQVLGLSRGGDTLPLSGGGPAVQAPTGWAYRVSETTFWLEWDRPVIADIQDRLRRTGSMAVREVAAQLGIADRLSHPTLLDAARFRLDEELTPDWQSTAIGASVDYAVHLPDELVPYYAGPS